MERDQYTRLLEAIVMATIVGAALIGSTIFQEGTQAQRSQAAAAGRTQIIAHIDALHADTMKELGNLKLAVAARGN